MGTTQYYRCFWLQKNNEGGARALKMIEVKTNNVEQVATILMDTGKISTGTEIYI